MTDWLVKSFLGGSMRMTEALVSACPTLLIGLCVAAILRFYLGMSGTRRLFGGMTLRSLPQSWAVGMLLPVCSIGVLPVLFEMRRAKLKAGAMSAFALSAPLFNPLSLLYGVTLSRPYVILMFALGSLFVVTIVGIIWDRFVTHSDVARFRRHDEDADSAESPIGIRRLVASFVYISRQVCGPAGVWAVAATVGVLLLAAVLPAGSLANAMGRDDWWAPARMAAVSIPAYAPPMLAMSQLGGMFQHANSPGAAFVLLVIGTGVNLGTLAWMSRQFGLRSVMVWFGSLMAVVMVIAYAVNQPLAPPGVDPSGHTHAFDIYANPIQQLDSNSGALVRRKLAEKFGPFAQICISLLGGMVVLGALFRSIGVDDSSFSRDPSSSSGSSNDQQSGTHQEPGTEQACDGELGFDRIVGPQVVGATLIAALVVLSVVMCYGFYPSPEECMKEIRVMRAEALSASVSADADHAKFWIPRWDQWSRRMEVGAFLRRGHVTPYQRIQGYLLRKKLDLLEHELEHDHDDPTVMRDLVNDVMATDMRWRKAYRDPYDGSVTTAESDYVAVDLKVDSIHEHRHSHDKLQSHDHRHNEFVGTHQHDHEHLHRHGDSPHGGRIISLGHQGHAAERESLHLELLPIRDHEVVVYPLRVKLGVLRPVKACPGVLKICLDREARSTIQERKMVELDWNPKKMNFHKTLTVDSDFGEAPELTGELIFPDGSKADF